MAAKKPAPKEHRIRTDRANGIQHEYETVDEIPATVRTNSPLRKLAEAARAQPDKAFKLTYASPRAASSTGQNLKKRYGLNAYSAGNDLYVSAGLTRTVARPAKEEQA